MFSCFRQQGLVEVVDVLVHDQHPSDLVGEFVRATANTPGSVRFPPRSSCAAHVSACFVIFICSLRSTRSDMQYNLYSTFCLDSTEQLNL